METQKKQFLFKILKSFLIVLLCVITVNGARKYLKKGDIITESDWGSMITGIDTNASAISDIQTENNTQDTNINDLLNRINTLESEVSALKTENTSQQTEIDNVVAASGDIVIEKGRHTTSSTSRHNWTIGSAEDPLVIGKPLIISSSGSSRNNMVRLRVTDGSETGNTTGTDRYFLMGGHSSERSTPSSMIIIPNKEIVKINLRVWNSGYTSKLIAYQ